MDSARVLPLCVVLPGDLQTLLMAVGLVRTLADDQPVLLALEAEHMSVVARLFGDAPVTFWFSDPDPTSRAARMGLQVMAFPADPVAMYSTAKIPISCMHTRFRIGRDPTREHVHVRRVVDAHGSSFVLAYVGSGTRTLKSKLLPSGIPIVDVTGTKFDNPLDLCELIESAMQVHASDCWFLTLADLLGGNSRKFCHAYVDSRSGSVCRRKYRRRVSVIYCQVRNHEKKYHVI